MTETKKIVQRAAKIKPSDRKAMSKFISMLLDQFKKENKTCNDKILSTVGVEVIEESKKLIQRNLK